MSCIVGGPTNWEEFYSGSEPNHVLWDAVLESWYVTYPSTLATSSKLQPIDVDNPTGSWFNGCRPSSIIFNFKVDAAGSPNTAAVYIGELPFPQNPATDGRSGGVGNVLGSLTLYNSAEEPNPTFERGVWHSASIPINWAGVAADSFFWLQVVIDGFYDATRLDFRLGTGEQFYWTNYLDTGEIA